MTTITDEEIQAKIDEAVAVAVAAKDARIAELETEQGRQALDAAVADAVAAKDVELADLRTQLDAAVADKVAAEQKLADTTAFLQAEADTLRAALLRDQRVGEVKEIGLFGQDTDPESHIGKNADKWAAMSDTEWTEKVTEWKLIADSKGISSTPPASPPLPSGVPPIHDALDNKPTGSAVSRVLALRTKTGPDGRAVDLTTVL